ncbi:MAG: T9SS type A sorting domain-containing protein [Chitinophagales bacterium]
MKVFAFCSLLFGAQLLTAQAPAIEWQNTIGSTQDDYIETINQTSDGGYIVCGTSYGGLGGDKTENKKGENDYWVIKLNADGSIQWQNTIQGNSRDHGKVAIETTDGGFLVAGESLSTAQNDKTEASNGFEDIWMLKLDAAGNIIWQNTIGGPSDETMRDVIQTADGGYLLLTTSLSPIGGDKTESSSHNDIWLIKTDAMGNVVWDNTITAVFIDYGITIREDEDGNYFLGCSSSSAISGDKTATQKGWMDLWVIKINPEGDILWQETYGGTFDDSMEDLLLTSDGGFICVGTSTSNAGENKTENGFGVQDWWVIKIDEQLNVEWDRTFGGSSFDYAKQVLETPEGDFILAGSSSSGISGNKTVPLAGSSDIWLIKLDANGNEIWQDAIGGNGVDQTWEFIHTADGGYCIAGNSDSNISGDKTENHLGQYDYWVVKLAPDICVPSIEICNTIDDDCNGIIDDGLFETISIEATGDTIFCQGGSVNLTATYTGISVQWKKNGTAIPGATTSTYTANKSGYYTCETTGDCGSAESAQIHVLVNKNPNASISAGGPTTFCAGGSVILTEVAVAGCTYQWYKGASPIAGATALTYTATTSGNYKCRVTKAATGCFKNSNVIAVSVPCREGESINSQTTFTIYPNPTNGTFTISDFAFVNHSCQIEIYNAIGQQIYIREIATTQNAIEVNLSNIASGIYIIKMRSGAIVTEQKLIIE